MSSSRVSATLVAVLVISIFGASHAWKQCSGTLCEKWMCEQNNNRKCEIAKAVDPTLTDDTCDQASGTPPFATALAACNVEQVDPFDSFCNINGVNVDVGLRYTKDDCVPPPGAPDNYVPPQLVNQGKQQVYVETNALIQVAEQKLEDAVDAVDQSTCTNGVPPVAYQPPEDFTCICTAVTGAEISACAEIIFNYYGNDPQFVNQYAQAFVDAATPLYLLYDVPGIETAEEAQAAATSAPSLAVQSVFAGNDIYVPPPPPASPLARRRRLRERKVIDRAMLRESQPHLAA